MEQFEQLLTCAICLDRYRIPKLLPCQHSFCMEPCMEGLVDYVRRQVKCPECRAEHRIPYQGVQGFPTNVTLQRFLELHIEITGELPDPTSGQVMERCNVCSEKSYCSFCSHCDKKICEECKGAHMDILRREISRINNQIRRGIHRLQDSLAIVEKNTQNIQTNCLSVSEEVDEIYRRLSKALKDRTDHLRGELDKYLGTELRTLTNLKDNLDQEISNILSNCDLADKHMTENVNWDDCELMDAKEIFLKTVDFIRNFEYETSDYARKVRLILAHDPNQLVLHVAGFGDLNITNQNNPFNQSGLLQAPGAPALIRSKSDHRLATQFRQQEERSGYDRGGYGEGSSEEPNRKFGERGNRNASGNKYDRFGRGGGGEGSEYGEEYDNETARPTRSRFRSRYGRHGADNNDSDTEQSSRGVRFTEQPAPRERERVLDTEDVARGPLSGITRLADSPRVMKKLQENESGVKKKEKDPPPAAAPQQPKVVPKRPPPPANRQLSEEDEITRIKKQNKGATTSSTTPAETEIRPAAVTPLKRDEPEERHSTQRKTPVPEAASSSEESDDSDVATPPQTQRKTPAKVTAPRRPSVEPTNKSNRSASSDSGSSDTSSGAVRSTGAAYTTEEVKQKILQKTETPTRTRQSSTGSTTSKEAPKTTYQNRYSKPTVVQPAKVEETESSSEEETESESDSDDVKPEPKEVNKSDIGPLLARSALARDNSTDSTRRICREEPIPSPIRPRYTSQREEPAAPVSKYTPRARLAPLIVNDDEHPPSRYTSRFLNKSKSSAAVSPTEEEERPRFGSASSAHYEDPDKYGTGRSRYMALKDRRQRLARSKSSHNFADDDDDNIDMSPTTSNPTAYLASRGYGSTPSSSNDLARSRSTHALKSRDNSPDRPPSTTLATSHGSNTEKDGAALTSWARYLKNKYGNRTSSKDKENGSPNSSSLNTSSASSSAAARRLSLGLPLRSSAEMGSSDDDSKNMLGSPTTPTAVTVAAQVGIAVATAGISPKGLYQQKGQQLFEIGSRGSEPGCFTWPRGVACGPDNSIVIADSSNHRVQVFDAQGRFREEFGTYGSGEGEFDCLAGVAVNRIGQFIIADRYNHRIQMFDPSGRFLRSFGSQGTSDGRFNYPWGITTDALGFIYVCDKENHRVQVFQSDGTFVGKFGTMGSKNGQLEHPQYIAVSNTNRVVVSDCNNHRVQVFDVNGRVISAFGSEGSAEGQFKFPRGIAVDDQGYICVADSGNNRIQIFTPEGAFLRSFGGWGSRPGEFKGLEGIAISSNGYILVCDRENHRIQVF